MCAVVLYEKPVLYYDCYHFCGFIADITDLVKRCMLTLVGEIWHFRNDHIIILATHYVPSLRQTVTISSLHMAAMSIPRKHNWQTHVQFVFHTCW